MTLLQTALQFYGTKEVPGEQANPIIRRMLDWMGFEWADDSLAWCSVFMNYVAFQAGHEKTGAANAKSWLNVGEKIAELEVAIPGDIVIFHRGDPSSWQGHVGIYINHDDTHIWVLGGNQSDQVNIGRYPISKLAGIRRLRKLTPSKGAALEGINIEP